MLVLKRVKDEALQIGSVRVKVLDVKGDTVSLGIDAPCSVKVLREELQARDSLNTIIRMSIHAEFDRDF